MPPQRDNRPDDAGDDEVAADAHLRPEEPGDDREARVRRGARDARGRRAVRLLQGYLWHPRELDLDLRAVLPTTLTDDVHVLCDPLEAAPFTFFDDGTLAASQVVYQLTVLRFVEEGDDPATLLPWAAETLQRELERTPAGVGWQVFDDLRDVF